MGTRNLIVVKDKNGEVKVAQYGQWDGYPEGQGFGILKFLREHNMDEFNEKIQNTRFIEPDRRDKEFIDSYDNSTPNRSHEPDLRKPEQKEWFEKFISRDLGAEVLSNIFNSDSDEILLKNSYACYEDEDCLCEWFYTLDLKNMILLAEGWNKKLLIGISDGIPEDKDYLELFHFEDEEDE